MRSRTAYAALAALFVGLGLLAATGAATPVQSQEPTAERFVVFETFGDTG